MCGEKVFFDPRLFFDPKVFDPGRPGKIPGRPGPGRPGQVLSPGTAAQNWFRTGPVLIFKAKKVGRAGPPVIILG